MWYDEPVKRAAVAAVGVFLGIACSSPTREVRKHTYAPSFEYLDREEVSGEMWALARNVSDINALLRTGERLDEAGRREVVRLLDEMASTAARLEGTGRTNHPLIDANIESFQEDIAMARAAAEEDPPDYYLAGSVAGSCVYCHR